MQLSLYRNCFRDGEKVHLGLKYKGVYYCLTHSKSKLIVPKKCLRMNTEDVDKITYLCKAVSDPVLINPTSMRISKMFFYNNVIRNNPDYYLNKKERR
jgi:hypothetical protein